MWDNGPGRLVGCESHARNTKCLLVSFKIAPDFLEKIYNVSSSKRYVTRPIKTHGMEQISFRAAPHNSEILANFLQCVVGEDSISAIRLDRGMIPIFAGSPSLLTIDIL